MKKIDMGQVAKEIVAGKYGIDQVRQDIGNQKYDWLDLERLPHWIQNKLSQEMANQQFEGITAKIDFEPRDWAKPIPLEDRIACGILGEEYYRIECLSIGRSKGKVVLNVGVGRCEIFRTREKLDSFIETLSQFRDEAFPE